MAYQKIGKLVQDTFGITTQLTDGEYYFYLTHSKYIFDNRPPHIVMTEAMTTKVGPVSWVWVINNEVVDHVTVETEEFLQLMEPPTEDEGEA